MLIVALCLIAHHQAALPSVQWSAPVGVGVVHWGVAAARAFSGHYSAFGTLAGTVATVDGGTTFFHASNTSLSEYMVPCSASARCSFHDFGAQARVDRTNTSWQSPSATFWSQDDTKHDVLRAETRRTKVTFSGLPYPSMPQHYTGENGLRFGGTATVVLPAGAGGGVASGPTFLQTTIVSWPPQSSNDSVATSIVLWSSTDGLSFTYRSTVASAADNPSSDEGPNEHAMERLADGSLLVVFRVDCGDGTHHPPGQWGRFQPYMQTRSHDGGKTWTRSAAVAGAPGCAYPHLLRLAGGPLLLSGGRAIFAGSDDNDLWVSWSGDGQQWERHSLSAAHNAGAPSGVPKFDPGRVNTTNLARRQTVAYTSLLPTADPLSALIGYDLIEGDPDRGGVHQGFVMRAELAR